MNAIKTWVTITEYVDLETGELISKSKFNREDYYKVRNSHKTEIKDGKGIKKYTTECRKRGQCKLEF